VATRQRQEPAELGEDFVQHPHETIELLRDAGPVRRVRFGNGLPVWLVTAHAEARSLLADSRLSKDNTRARELVARYVEANGGQRSSFESSLGAHMLNSDPPDHTRLRRLVNQAFTARTVSRLRPRIEEITAGLLDDLERAGEADLLASFALPLPITVICELLGIPEGEREGFRTWSNTLLTAATPDQVGEASRRMAEYLTALIAAKRAAPTQDLLSDLVHASDEGDQLSEVELLSMAFLLLVAGHETTVNLIGNGMHALLRNPDQLAALRADPGLLPNAVEEFLRYDSPVNFATLRFTAEPVRVGEVEIPADEFVMISLLGGNRDATRFPEPDRLDLTRQTAGHLAFGHGIHHCVGAPLARLEGEIALGRLIERFGTIELTADPAELRWRVSTLLRGLETLPVRVAR
jgi:cytochrome P450